MARKAESMNDRSAQLRRILGEVFESANPNVVNPEDCREDFIFHMTDWEADLFRVAELYSSPEKFTASEAEGIISGLLYHASDHILRAARLQYDYLPPAAREPST
jgi:hypothetical protein